MLEASSRFETEQGQKYVAQLCKHFGHKIETILDGDHGECVFGFGRAIMDADETGIEIKIHANEEAEVEQGKKVIESHLLRFAFREPDAKLDWSAIAPLAA